VARGFKGFMKGIGTGLAVGAFVGAAANMMMRDSKKFRRGSGKVVRAVGDLVENVQYMMK